jgi:hypothetical protein
MSTVVVTGAAVPAMMTVGGAAVPDACSMVTVAGGERIGCLGAGGVSTADILLAHEDQALDGST